MAFKYDRLQSCVTFSIYCPLYISKLFLIAPSSFHKASISLQAQVFSFLMCIFILCLCLCISTLDCFCNCFSFYQERPLIVDLLLCSNPIEFLESLDQHLHMYIFPHNCYDVATEYMVRIAQSVPKIMMFILVNVIICHLNRDIIIPCISYGSVFYKFIYFLFILLIYYLNYFFINKGIYHYYYYYYITKNLGSSYTLCVCIFVVILPNCYWEQFTNKRLN